MGLLILPVKARKKVLFVVKKKAPVPLRDRGFQRRSYH